MEPAHSGIIRRSPIPPPSYIHLRLDYIFELPYPLKKYPHTIAPVCYSEDMLSVGWEDSLQKRERQRSPITRFEDIEKQVSALLFGHEPGLSIIDELDGKQFGIDMPALVNEMRIYKRLITMLIFLYALG